MNIQTSVNNVLSSSHHKDEYSPFSATTFKPKNTFTPMSNHKYDFVFPVKPILIDEESKDNSTPTLPKDQSLGLHRHIIKD